MTDEIPLDPLDILFYYKQRGPYSTLIDVEGEVHFDLLEDACRKAVELYPTGKMLIKIPPKFSFQKFKFYDPQSNNNYVNVHDHPFDKNKIKDTVVDMAKQPGVNINVFKEDENKYKFFMFCHHSAGDAVAAFGFLKTMIDEYNKNFGLKPLLQFQYKRFDPKELIELGKVTKEDKKIEMKTQFNKKSVKIHCPQNIKTNEIRDFDKKFDVKTSKRMLDYAKPNGKITDTLVAILAKTIDDHNFINGRINKQNIYISTPANIRPEEKRFVGDGNYLSNATIEIPYLNRDNINEMIVDIAEQRNNPEYNPYITYAVMDSFVNTIIKYTPQFIRPYIFKSNMVKSKDTALISNVPIPFDFVGELYGTEFKDIKMDPSALNDFPINIISYSYKGELRVRMNFRASDFSHQHAKDFFDQYFRNLDSIMNKPVE
ncbi:hypothetical protein ACFL1H_01515 [Nanoarchaeota archaeon]